MTRRVEGEKIREARQSAGMSQSELARRIRTTERNISRWETGSNQPRIESVAAIAAVTGKTVDFFLSSPNHDPDPLEAEVDRFAAEMDAA